MTETEMPAETPEPARPAPEPRFAYPVALDLRGRRCVVVGGGVVGARKAAGLAEAGACVVIVAPTFSAEAEAVSAVRVAEPFAPVHLDGAFLAIAATDNAAVNAAVERAARERGVLVNLAAPGDGGETGDFAAMAAVRRGDLLLAVAGGTPSLTIRLRAELAARYGAEWVPVSALFKEIRAAAKERIGDVEARGVVLRRLSRLTDRLLSLFAAGGAETARREAWECLP